MYFVGGDIATPPFIKNPRLSYLKDPAYHLNIVERNFYKKVFDNAITIAAGLKKSYFEDTDILDYPPVAFTDTNINQKLGLARNTSWGDAKLSDSKENLNSFISKLIRSDLLLVIKYNELCITVKYP